MEGYTENLLEVKDALYEAISRYGEKRIFSDIVQGDSPDAIHDILEHSFKSLEKSNGPKPDTYTTVAEALLHYLLTVALIPSQRKVSFESVEIDIAVPDTRTLGASPQDAVVISFPKTKDLDTINAQLNKIKKIQPNSNNIWVVLESSTPLDAKVYTLGKENLTFANIINDLISFSSTKKQSKLKIFKI